MPVINIPAQVISITDTDGSVTPLRVRFKDPASGEIRTYSEVNVIKRSDKQMDVNFLCSVRQYNREIKFYLGYNYSRHVWTIQVRDTREEYDYLLNS